MIRIGELKKVFTPVRHENLRALLQYSAREFAGDDAFIIKTKRGYKQITGIYENGRFRMKDLEKKHTGKRKTKEKKRYNQKIREKKR